MTLSFAFYYFLLFFIICSCIGVLFSPNPVHSIFFLVCVFLNVSAFFFFINAEFLAIIFIIIYVGAIAVLFLFVVMMLNIKAIEYQQTFYRYIPISGLICLTFFIQIVSLFYFFFFSENISISSFSTDIFYYLSWIDLSFFVENAKILGVYVFNYYFYAFFISGLILLLAMISSIILTLVSEGQTKRQIIYKQLIKNYNKTISLKKFN